MFKRLLEALQEKPTALEADREVPAEVAALDEAALFARWAQVADGPELDGPHAVLRTLDREALPQLKVTQNAGGWAIDLWVSAAWQRFEPGRSAAAPSHARYLMLLLKHIAGLPPGVPEGWDVGRASLRMGSTKRIFISVLHVRGPQGSVALASCLPLPRELASEGSQLPRAPFALLWERGSAAFRDQDVNGVRAHFTDAIAYASAGRGVWLSELFEVQRAFAWSLDNLGRPAEALKVLEAAEQTLARNPAADVVQRAQAAWLRAAILDGLDRVDDALALLRQRVATAVTELGEWSIGHADALEALAVHFLDNDRPAEAREPANRAARIVEALLGKGTAYLDAQRARLRALVALRDPAAAGAVRAALADATPLRLFTDIASFQMLLGELSAQEGRHDEALGLYFPALRALQNAECRPLAAGAAMQSAKSLAALGRRDEAQAQLALASALMAAFLPEGNRHRRGLAAELAALTAP